MHKPQKRFGQNFLQNEEIIDSIISSFAPAFNQNIIEIGPGLGALTSRLIESQKKLKVIEIDNNLVKKLQEKFDSSLEIINQDALEVDFETLVDNEKKIRIIGNLPYNISTPLLFHLLKYAANIKDMLFMLQEEVVDRIIAKPGCKQYGKLTIMLQFFAEASKLFQVPPEAFYPAPKVNSAIILITPHTKPKYSVSSFKLFKEIVTVAFNFRRKTIGKVLSDYISKESIKSLDISPQDRPENLSIEDYIKISDFIFTQK